MKTVLKATATTIAMAVLLAFSTPALACWDGYLASQDEKLEINGSDDVWKRWRAKHLGVWLARIGELVPDDGTVVVHDGYVDIATYDDHASKDQPSFVAYNYTTMAQAFRVVAKHYNVAPKKVERARKLEIEPMTVQVGFFRDRQAALTFADTIMEQAWERGLSLHGYYDAGGFPAVNPFVHVIEDEDTKGWKAVVGAFITTEEAEQARDLLKEKLELSGLVRPL